MGHSASELFASNSGIHPDKYKGALSNSIPEINGPNGPQQLLIVLPFELMENQDLMAEFRCMIDKKIMQRFGLGKYAQVKDKTIDLLKSLKNILINDRDVVPALTQNIPTPSGARISHVYFREKNTESAKNLTIELSRITN
ncbi:MAG: hypothetical protein ACNYPE_06290 [Candidatus Azotimanducaceae bacterium WSBS_2022_MAG_OTU7]